RGVALLDAAPRNPAAYRAAIGLALLSDDRRGVLEFAERAVPEDGSGLLALRHAELQLAIAVMWDDAARLQLVDRELESLPAAVPAAARARAMADVDAVRARSKGDTVARGRAI